MVTNAGTGPPARQAAAKGVDDWAKNPIIQPPSFLVVVLFVCLDLVGESCRDLVAESFDLVGDLVGESQLLGLFFV